MRTHWSVERGLHVLSPFPLLYVETSTYITCPCKLFTRLIWDLQMKAMEEEVLIKNGEIKILRDSLHQTESILEEQRRSHFLLEQEKTQALGDKEKEFSKKVTQSFFFFFLVLDTSFTCLLSSFRSVDQSVYKSSRKISTVICLKYFLLSVNCIYFSSRLYMWIGKGIR